MAQYARNQGQPTTTTTSPAHLMGATGSGDAPHLYTGRTGALMHARRAHAGTLARSRAYTREARPIFGPPGV